jgi:co-chaperonin GroES (HSP10)
MFRPVNRYILVDIPQKQEPETSSGIVLPESFKPTEEKHMVVSVISWATDVKFENVLNINSKLVIDRSMIEEVDIKGKKYSLILENYVLGII